MAGVEKTLEQSLRELLEGDSALRIDREGATYPDKVLFQPSFFAARGAGGKQKPELKATTQKDLQQAPELQPTHVAEQGIESRIDKATGNVVYAFPIGNVTIGFYDREKAGQANALAKKSGTPTFGLTELVNGKDELLPKLQILPTQPFVRNLVGKSFPPMFGSRSVVFERDTRYGIVVSVDDSLVGKQETFKDTVLDPAYVLEHLNEMNFLYLPIMKAAKQEGLKFDDLLLSETITAEQGLSYLYYLNRASFETRISYTKTPQITVAVRLNGTPIALTLAQVGGGIKFAEIGYGAQKIADGRHVAVISRRIIQNPQNSADSYEGDILYKVISRQESVAEADENPEFGIAEVQIMRVVEISDFTANFSRVREPQNSSLQSLGGDDVMKTLGEPSFRGADHTAGRSSIGELRQAHIETQQVGFERVFVRDAFCLVHRELKPEAQPYTATATVN